MPAKHAAAEQALQYRYYKQRKIQTPGERGFLIYPLHGIVANFNKL